MQSFTLTTLQEVAFDFEHDTLWLKPKRQLEQAVLQTLAYFDVFNFPLTSWEVYKYLWVEELVDKKISYFHVREVLAHLPAVEYQDGFYFLAGQSALVLLRKERQIIAREKYRRAHWVIKVLSLLPFVKMIAVCNTLAYDNVRDDSDIDLFIVTAENKIWTARFYAAVFLKIFCLRPTTNNKKDKICLNFFIAENSLDLQPLMIEHDIYFSFWLKQILPIYDDKIFAKLKKENAVVGENINHGAPSGFCHKRKVKPSIIAQGFKSFLEVINSWEWLEKLLKFAQLKIMPRALRDKIGRGNGVVINDKVLKFHENDRREEYREEWKVRSKK